ncbi:MAG TPA: carboxypeptidase regulatory-like domain-containing protein, partial [Candidatus Baltobacteraceae bacterium]
VVDVADSDAKLNGAPHMPVNFLVNVASASSIGAGSTTVTTSDGPGTVDLVVTQPFTIPQDHSHAVRLDYNAFESLNLDAAGNLLARSSLFVAPVDDIGRIRGRVVNNNGSPVADATVVAVAPDGSVGNTSFTGSRGNFSVGTLRGGTYKLVIYNTYTTASGRVITASGESASNASVQSFAGPDVTISGGDPTSAGTIKD